MIVKCNKCKKKFNLDDRLIPDKGRLLKCGNCHNEWFFKLNQKSNFDFQYENKNTNKFVEKDQEPSKSISSVSEIKIPINHENLQLDKSDKQNKSEKKEDKSKYILNNTILIIITLIAIIILFDTFKMYLSKFFPNIIPILDSLYESLHDLNLFVKDLFN